MKKLIEKLKKSNNRGSSFVLVIVSITFLSIMVSAIMMGVLLTYRLKFYKINSLNNFYSVEKSMDEIYAGIGATVNNHLYSAYTTTAEMVIVYDPINGQYTNIDNADANELFKSLFMKGLSEDESLKSGILSTLKGFITDSNVELEYQNLKIIYRDKNGNDIYGYLYNPKTNKLKKQGTAPQNAGDIKTIVFKNIGVKRTIKLDGSDKETMAQGTYVQSILTDIVVSQPEYNVSFDVAASSGDSFYNFALLADMGVEINGGQTNADVNVKGNIYAASDYYNKDYNSVAATKVTDKYASTVTTHWGTTDNSAYSGIFVNGGKTTLSMDSDLVVCSGSLAAFNGAAISLSGRSSTISELWADNIIIGGSEGGSITASANAYIYDDTELNAEKSSLVFTKGSYFGYSFAANDIRSLNLLRTAGKFASNYKLRQHFSDSAVIVNGKDSTLNFQNLDSLYIAGKSYIEFSKIAASKLSDEEKTDLGVADGDEYAFTKLKDYSTGQSLDVKSNQLMFLSQWELVEEEEDENGNVIATLKFPSTLSKDSSLTELYQNFLTEVAKDTYTLTAIKQTVSGHDYYYLYIENTDKDGDGVDDVEQFIEKYYELLAGAHDVSGKLYNVVKYEDFPVNLIIPDNSKINASGAVTAQNKNTGNPDTNNSLFLKKTADTTMNVDTALKAASTSKEFKMLLGNLGTTETNLVYEGLKDNAAKLAVRRDASGAVIPYSPEETVSNFINYMYINMKDHLTVVDKKDDADNEISAWDIAGYTNGAGGYSYTYNAPGDVYSYNYSITPLNYYVDYDYLFTHRTNINESVADSVVVLNYGDVTLKTTNGDGTLQGIVICGGDVTFDSSVKQFRGMVIAGGKVIINNSTNISADASYIANLLKKCAESTDEKVNCITSKKILKQYEAVDEENKSEVTGVSISDISYQDILSFQNWKKNVE